MRTLSAFLLSLVLLNTDLLQAQQAALFDPDLRLGVSTSQNGETTVVAEGRATLYDAFTGARLFKPVIMGLRLADIDLQTVIGERDSRHKQEKPAALSGRVGSLIIVTTPP